MLLHPPPAVPHATLSALLRDAYGIDGRIDVLAAERDQNVRIRFSGNDLLLKLLPPHEAAQAAALASLFQHIARTDPALPVPRLQLSGRGRAVETLMHDGQAYNALLLTWLPGRILAEAGITSAVRRQAGALLARLGRAMRGFMHVAVPERQLVWSMMTADQHLGSVSCLADATWQRRAETCLDDYASRLKPMLHALRCQIIHGDVHPWNMIASGDGSINGIIDFGDMIYGALVIDPANTIADFLLGGEDPTPVFRDIVSAYVDVTELEELEAELIPGLVRVRLLTSAMVSRMRETGGLGNTDTIASLAQASLAAFDAVEARYDQLIDVCRVAAGFQRRPQPDAMLARRVKAMGAKPLLFYDPPLHIVKGEGMWLTAADGRKYLDCYNNVPHVGHAHPRVARAVANQLRKLNTNTRYLTDESIAYAERLKATLHPSLDTVVFVNSGSEANDVAVRMARAWTRHKGGLCMDFAYHGVTTEADAISPSNYPPGKWHAPHIRLLEAPDGYRGEVKHGAPDFVQHYAAFADAALNDLRSTGFGCAFGIIDSAFMTNGIPDVPRGYVQAVVGKVHAAGGLFIADEVQSGFGRMGTALWGHQHHGIVPDFVTIGKPAGNGFPLGVLITRAEIHAHFVAETGAFFSTFGGNNAACAAGLAVLDIIDEDGLVEKARINGEALRSGLRELANRHQQIGDVRGSGLAIGVELVRSRQTREPEGSAAALLNRVRDHGVLIGRDGKHGNVLKIRPPLAFEGAHVPLVVEALDRALRE